MPKKMFFFLPLLFSFITVDAQEKSNIQLRIETGVLILSASENIGLFLNVEPQLKSSKNTNIGLRIAVVLNSQKIENNDSLEFHINDKLDNGGVSFVPTFDYSWNESKFRSNIGLGIGYYLVSNKVDVSRTFITNPIEDVFIVNVKNQLGFLLRGGIAIGKTRLGLEYNFIRKADIIIPNGHNIGTINNSYLGLSIGFTIGSENGS